jgi:hypothetical protein
MIIMAWMIIMTPVTVTVAWPGHGHRDGAAGRQADEAIIMIMIQGKLA